MPTIKSREDTKVNNTLPLSLTHAVSFSQLNRGNNRLKTKPKLATIIASNIGINTDKIFNIIGKSKRNAIEIVDNSIGNITIYICILNLANKIIDG